MIATSSGLIDKGAVSAMHQPALMTIIFSPSMLVLMLKDSLV